MADKEPEDPEYPGHTAAFARLMKLGQGSQGVVNREALTIADLAKIRDDELVMLAHTRNLVTLPIWRDGVDAEVERRTTAALMAFKDQSKIASDRLEGLTRWLIAYTIVLALLGLIVVMHDLTH